MSRNQKSRKQDAFAEAAAVFREQGRVLRTMEVVRLGVHPRTLYAMRDAGALEQLGRGLYRLADLPPLRNPRLVAVAPRGPAGGLCLLSAPGMSALGYWLALTLTGPIQSLIAGAQAGRAAHPCDVRFARDITRVLAEAEAQLSRPRR